MVILIFYFKFMVLFMTKKVIIELIIIIKECFLLFILFHIFPIEFLFFKLTVM